MASRSTYPSRSFNPIHVEISSEYIPRHTSAESRPDHPGNRFDLEYQPLHYQGSSNSHRPGNSSTKSQRHRSQTPAERRIAELQMQVKLLKSRLRMQKSSQAVSAARIAALAFYLEAANEDIAGVVQAYNTEPAQAYVERCDAAMANANISRRFLHQMRDESAPENVEKRPRQVRLCLASATFSSIDHFVLLFPLVVLAMSKQVHRTNSYHHELPVLDEPTQTALESKSYQADDLKLPPIRAVLRKRPWLESGRVGQYVELQEDAHLRPIVETSHPELHPEVSEPCATCLHDSVRTSALPPAPSPPFQPRSPHDEPVSHSYGPCGPSYSPNSPSYSPASPSHESASPRNRPSSPAYGASASSSVHRTPSPKYQYESPANQLGSAFQSPGRVSQPGSSVHRPSTSNQSRAISSQPNKRKLVSPDTGECNSRLGKRIRSC